MEKMILRDGEFYNESDGSGDLLLLLHAGVADSRMWEPQYGDLAKKFRVNRCDMRGFGESSLPDAPFAYHQDVRSLVENLGEPTWICAASFGASKSYTRGAAYRAARLCPHGEHVSRRCGDRNNYRVRGIP